MAVKSIITATLPLAAAAFDAVYHRAIIRALRSRAKNSGHIPGLVELGCMPDPLRGTEPH